MGLSPPVSQTSGCSNIAYSSRVPELRRGMASRNNCETFSLFFVPWMSWKINRHSSNQMHFFFSLLRSLVKSVRSGQTSIFSYFIQIVDLFLIVPLWIRSDHCVIYLCELYVWFVRPASACVTILGVLFTTRTLPNQTSENK